MNEKKAKKVRRIARYFYENNLHFWQRAEPPKWRIFKHKRRELCKPIYKEYVRRVKGW